MNRWLKHRNLRIIIEINGSDVDFLAMIKRLDIELVRKDDQISKEFMDKFRMESIRESKE